MPHALVRRPNSTIATPVTTLHDGRRAARPACRRRRRSGVSRGRSRAPSPYSRARAGAATCRAPRTWSTFVTVNVTSVAKLHTTPCEREEHRDRCEPRRHPFPLQLPWRSAYVSPRSTGEAERVLVSRTTSHTRTPGRCRRREAAGASRAGGARSMRDLPEPFWPSTAMHSPRGMTRSTSSSATRGARAGALPLAPELLRSAAPQQQGHGRRDVDGRMGRHAMAPTGDGPGRRRRRRGGPRKGCPSRGAASRGRRSDGEGEAQGARGRASGRGARRRRSPGCGTGGCPTTRLAQGAARCARRGEPSVDILGPARLAATEQDGAAPGANRSVLGRTAAVPAETGRGPRGLVQPSPSPS